MREGGQDTTRSKDLSTDVVSETIRVRSTPEVTTIVEKKINTSGTMGERRLHSLRSHMVLGDY